MWKVSTYQKHESDFRQHILPASGCITAETEGRVSTPILATLCSVCCVGYVTDTACIDRLAIPGCNTRFEAAAILKFVTIAALTPTGVLTPAQRGLVSFFAWPL